MKGGSMIIKIICFIFGHKRWYWEYSHIEEHEPVYYKKYYTRCPRCGDKINE